ncbi:MAG: hypothetical protein PHX21_13290 [bacterium]|nr:hypothetical protein [bacterium]
MKRIDIIILVLIIVSDVTKGEELFKDKEIFNPGRKWTYSVFFINTKKDTVDSQKVELEVLKGSYGLQRQIEWRYYKNGKWKIGENTGVVEGAENIFLHPPRNGDFRFTELTNFPEIYYGKVYPIENTSPMRALKKWSGRLNIGRGWGEWEGVTVETSAKIGDKKCIRTRMKDSLECWQIDTKGESKLGIYKTTYYFHTQYGFVRWEYKKPDSTRVILDLERASGF